MTNHSCCNLIRRFQENLMDAIGYRIIFGALLALFMLNGLVSAQSPSTQFVPFRSFIDQTYTANAADYLVRPESKVKNAAAFEAMRQHILNMYQGVEVNHSFVLDSSYYDCVPIGQKPAVR